jgi:hypothetical protein
MHEKDDHLEMTAISCPASAPRPADVGCAYCRHANGDRDIFPSVLRHLRLNAPLEKALPLSGGASQGKETDRRALGPFARADHRHRRRPNVSSIRRAGHRPAKTGTGANNSLFCLSCLFTEITGQESANWAPVAGSWSCFRLYQRAPYDKYPTDCPRDGLVKLAIMLHVRNNDGACAH